MFQHSFRLTVISAALFLCAVCAPIVPTAEAQSGSRGASSGGGGRAISGGRAIGGGRSFGGSGSRRGPSPEELRRQQQQLQQQQQLFADQQAIQNAKNRDQFIKELALDPFSSTNKQLAKLALKDAKTEFKQILKSDDLPSGDQIQLALPTPHRLNRKEINRTTATIKWPKALKDEPYTELIEEVEEKIDGDWKNVTASGDEIRALLNEVHQSLVNEIPDKSISSSDYSKARRFLSGLSFELTHPVL